MEFKDLPQEVQKYIIKEIVDPVVKMRELQIRFFKSRNSSILKDCKVSEHRVDALCAALLKVLAGVTPVSAQYLPGMENKGSEG